MPDGGAMGPIVKRYAALCIGRDHHLSLGRMADRRLGWASCATPPPRPAPGAGAATPGGTARRASARPARSRERPTRRPVPRASAATLTPTIGTRRGPPPPPAVGRSAATVTPREVVP